MEVTLLLLLTFLQLKHTLADFVLRWPFMLSQLWRYAHAGRAAHAAVHAVLTGAILLALSLPAHLALMIAAVEWAVHFHLDWIKAMHTRASGAGMGQTRFWVAFGIDQLAHQLTYVGIIWWVVLLSG